MAFTMCALIGSSMLLAAADGGWQAGVARAEITPREAMWLAGYASRDHEATGALHPLWVKALALRDAQGHSAVIITNDLLGYPKELSDPIRARIKEKLGLDPAQIILSASHTHSGPVLGNSLRSIYPIDDAGKEKVQRYSAWLVDQVVATAEAAFAALAPAQLASGNGVTRFGVNRRNNNEGQILDLHDLKGPIDHAVPVLSVTGADGAIKALLFGYACHCTVLCEYQWCGDYAGFAQIALEQEHPGCTAMFFAGCGADTNPLPRRSVAIAEQYGRELAAAVDRVVKEGPAPLEATLATEYTEVALALEAPPTREKLAELAQTSSVYVRRAMESLIAQMDAGRPLPTTYPCPVQVWRVGGQAIAVLGGEVVVDYAIAIKQMLGRNAFVMGYANDVMAYIASARVINEGGYEGADAQVYYGLPAKWQPGIEQQILDTVKDLAGRAGALPPPAPK